MCAARNFPRRTQIFLPYRAVCPSYSRGFFVALFFCRGTITCPIVNGIPYTLSHFLTTEHLVPLLIKGELKGVREKWQNTEQNPPSRQVPRHLPLKREAREWSIAPLHPNTLSPFCKGGTVSAANERGIEKRGNAYKIKTHRRGDGAKRTCVSPVALRVKCWLSCRPSFRRQNTLYRTACPACGKPAPPSVRRIFGRCSRRAG